MKNYTKEFINLVDKTVILYEDSFNKLEEFENKDIHINQIEKYFFDGFSINSKNDNSYNKHIEEYIKTFDSNFSMSLQKLKDISKQIKIIYFLGNKKETDLNKYFTIAEYVLYNGIYSEDRISDFSNTEFWIGLIEKIYKITIVQGLRKDFEMLYSKEDEKLLNSIKYFKNKFNIDIDCIDGNVCFKKYEEKNIVSITEKKLKQIDLFEFINYILIQNRNNTEIPFNYIINLSIKNIANSKMKKKNEKDFKSILEFLINFLNLYQISSFNQFEYIYIDETNIKKLLRKQILNSNLYMLNYPLSTKTLIEYIDNLLNDKNLNESFIRNFVFSNKELIEFLLMIEKINYRENIIILNTNIFYKFQKIIEFFSIDSKDININYDLPLKLNESKNLFLHNPILKYKGNYYLIGFKYFKMNFYNALVEKIRLKLDTNINYLIGNNIDKYVKNMFENKNYEIYSGEYKINKNGRFECDLVVKLDNEIIFFEHKNKSFRKSSYAGWEVELLQDFIRGFVTSQTQLLRHEKHILERKEISFLDGKNLKYNGERIIKISVVPNNWYSIMNNLPKSMLTAIIGLRFNFKKNISIDDKIKKDIESTNEDLIKLQNILEELQVNYNLDTILNKSLFLPLELISEKVNNTYFLDCIIGLLTMKCNTPNIYDAYYNYERIIKFRETK